MYGLIFYLNKDVLKEAYGLEKNHHDAYEEIRDILRHYGFHWLSNSFYFSRGLNKLVHVFQAVKHLKGKEWFVKSLVSLNVFKMEDMSDFTEYIRSDKELILLGEEEDDTDIEKGKTKYKRPLL
ncbi:Virulence-associated protein D [[Mycoplasma] anseris]|uniref:Virulence protein n=1 Tax=[Mycoplasma] anseris TaxID=92400 RepID=A0A2Z4ND85_9BACT|nr:Virulence-associated protein D [[Mycoplasma] anseris]AWX69543.1 virulence protein [[Mycoplasma] anseris]